MSSFRVRCCKQMHKDAGRHTTLVYLCINSCVRVKTAATCGICRPRVSWRTSPNFKTRDESPPATASCALFSVCLHSGREWQDTLREISFRHLRDIFREKRGGGKLASQLFHISLVDDHPKVMTHNLLNTATKKGRPMTRK